MSERPLNEDMNAQRWAREFNKVFAELHEGCELDEGWLIGWFSNAIMCGHDVALRRAALQMPASDSIGATDAIVQEFRGKSIHGLAIALADNARFLESDVAHWKRMYECAQNANAYRQDALELAAAPQPNAAPHGNLATPYMPKADSAGEVSASPAVAAPSEEAEKLCPCGKPERFMSLRCAREDCTIGPPSAPAAPFDPVKRLDEILNGYRDQGGTITRASEESAVRQLVRELLSVLSERTESAAPRAQEGGSHQQQSITPEPASAAPSESGIEPTAWAYKDKEGNETLTRQPPDRVTRPEDYIVTPLYEGKPF